MYTTRRVNPKTSPNNGDGFLSIGDPYSKDIRTQTDRVKGRQFQTNPPKAGQLEGYFGEFHYSTDNYQDTNGYRVTQPRERRKLGFGSYDAHKRDEFTLHVRAQQWKEHLKGEQTSTVKRMKEEDELKSRSLPAIDLGRSSGASSSSSSSSSRRTRAPPSPGSEGKEMASSGGLGPYAFQTEVPTHLYDIGKEKSNGVTPICNKCPRDTFYCKHRVGATAVVSARRLGGVRTMALAYGGTEQTLAKPPHGRKSAIKEFYDGGHIKSHEAAV